MISKEAFITLLSSENYLEAVLVLFESLKLTDNSYPLVVAVTENIFSYEILDTFQKFNLPYIIISKLDYSDQTIQLCKSRGWNTVLNTASKYNLFNLKYFDKLVYLDADSIVLQNIDNLFSYKDGSMLWDSSRNEGFSASYVFSPRNHCLEMYEILSNNSLHVDGDLFSNLWFHLKDNPDYRIPFEYFEYYLQVNKDTLPKAKAVHFVNREKPWLIEKDAFPCNNEEQKEILDKYYSLLTNIRTHKEQKK